MRIISIVATVALLVLAVVYHDVVGDLLRLTVVQIEERIRVLRERGSDKGADTVVVEIQGGRKVMGGMLLDFRPGQRTDEQMQEDMEKGLSDYLAVMVREETAIFGGLTQEGRDSFSDWTSREFAELREKARHTDWQNLETVRAGVPHISGLATPSEGVPVNTDFLMTAKRRAMVTERRWRREAERELATFASEARVTLARVGVIYGQLVGERLDVARITLWGQLTQEWTEVLREVAERRLATDLAVAQVLDASQMAFFYDLRWRLDEIETRLGQDETAARRQLRPD